MNSIEALFDSIAARYDLANSLNSLGVHKLWNRALIKNALSHNPVDILDLCAGTGEIAKGLLQRAPAANITLVDFSEEMLQVAKKRLKEQVVYVKGNAEKLCMNEESFDLATCAYGVRNISNRKSAFKELFRVLRPKGVVAICELTRPDAKMMQSLHRAYLKTVVPFVGRLLTKNKEAYSYLSSSINTFIAKESLAKELEEAGFCNVRYAPQTFGIATLFFAEKP